MSDVTPTKKSSSSLFIIAGVALAAFATFFGVKWYVYSSEMAEIEKNSANMVVTGVAPSNYGGGGGDTGAGGAGGRPGGAAGAETQGEAAGAGDTEGDAKKEEAGQEAEEAPANPPAEKEEAASENA